MRECNDTLLGHFLLRYRSLLMWWNDFGGSFIHMWGGVEESS